jgi:hypothetical protein
MGTKTRVSVNVSSWLFTILVLALEVLSSTDLECELFIAPSTIPRAGYGVFSATEKKPGDTIGNGDVAFVLVDFAWSIGKKHRNPFEVRRND